MSSEDFDDDDQEDEYKGSNEEPRRDPTQHENPGFVAFDLHLEKLKLLLDMWAGLINRVEKPEDELVMDEIRHGIKVTLSNQSHDQFIDTVSKKCTTELIGE
jgi:hypothetical protein